MDDCDVLVMRWRFNYPVPKSPIDALHNHVCSPLSFVSLCFGAFPLYMYPFSFFARVSPIMHSSLIVTHFFLFRLIIQFHFLTVLDILGKPGAHSSSILCFFRLKKILFTMTFMGVYLLFSSFISVTYFLPFPVLRCTFLMSLLTHPLLAGNNCNQLHG